MPIPSSCFACRGTPLAEGIPTLGHSTVGIGCRCLGIRHKAYVNLGGMAVSIPKNEARAALQGVAATRAETRDAIRSCSDCPWGCQGGISRVDGERGVLLPGLWTYVQVSCAFLREVFVTARCALEAQRGTSPRAEPATRSRTTRNATRGNDRKEASMDASLSKLGAVVSMDANRPPGGPAKGPQRRGAGRLRLGESDERITGDGARGP